MGAGQAKPQYPHWICYEITEANLPAIRAALGVARNNMVVQKLIRTAAAMPEGTNRCEELLRSPNDPALTIENITSYALAGGFMMRMFIVIDTILKYPVCYLSVKVGNPLINTVFRHNTIREDGAMILALGAYISWTCSFTNSAIECLGGRVMATYYSEQAETYKLNAANFLTDFIGRSLLAELNTTYSAALPTEVTNVIFYSIGIAGSRERHRKNGKLDACRFMDQWINIIDNSTLPDKFEYPAYDNTMYYFYMKGNKPFNLSPLQRRFIDAGEDISQPKAGGHPLGHPNFFDDDNFSCPGGAIEGGRRRRRRTRRRRNK